METPISPMSYQRLMLFFLQLALILITSRSLAELAKKIHLPAVIGELVAGIMIGPSFFGWIFPSAFSFVFPNHLLQHRLLETISWLGVVLLMLLTGLETDIRVFKRLGRQSLFVALFGLVVPLGLGYAFGYLLPEQVLVPGSPRAVFAMFVAIAMAISAIPVIARILLEERLLSSPVGFVILSASIVDDIIGWFLLSIVTSIVHTGTIHPLAILKTLLFLLTLAIIAYYVLWPVLRALFRWIDDKLTLEWTDIVGMVALTFLFSALFESFQIHAVFGGFISGLLLRQVPRLKLSSIRNLESVTLSIFSPIFFAYAGLKVNLFQLSGFWLPLSVLGVALASKLIGCFVGARLAGVNRLESLAIASGMNARGAVGIVVAIVGLSYGLLTNEMYSSLVLMAICTSILAPVGLKFLLHKMPNAAATTAPPAGGPILKMGSLRILVPTSGGHHVTQSATFLIPLCHHKREDSVTLLSIQPPAPRRVPWPWTGEHTAPIATPDALKRRLQDHGVFVNEKRLSAAVISEAILTESHKNYDLLVLGASRRKARIKGELLREIVRQGSPPIVIVSSTASAGDNPAQRFLVCYDGSDGAELALELALHCATRSAIHVTVLHAHTEEFFDELHRVDLPYVVDLQARIRQMGFASALDRMSFQILPQDYSIDQTIIKHCQSHHYDLVLVGARRRRIAQQYLFGHSIDKIVAEIEASVAVVIPPLARGA